MTKESHPDRLITIRDLCSIRLYITTAYYILTKRHDPAL